MLESEPRRLLLVSLVGALVLAATPASASVLDEYRDTAEDGVQDGRAQVADVAGKVPETGTVADALIDELAEPDDETGPPETGTAADDVVEDAADPENPTVNAARNEARVVLDLVAEKVREVRDTIGQDPIALVGDQVEPIREAAEDVLPSSDSYEVEEAAPASGEATAVATETSPELIMATSAAAAAAALVAFWLVSSGSAGAAGAGATGTTAAAGSEMRRLLPFASPLFTRFAKDTVLGHPKREALYALILQDPGVSLQSLCDSTGLSRTAVTHHLRLLEMQHLIVSKRMGRSRHYYENGGRFGRDQKDAYAVLHNDRSKEVARYVRDHPGAIQKALCQALGIQPSIAHWHLRRLQEAQLVEAVRHGRTVSYFPGAGLKSLDRPMVPPEAAAPANEPEPLPAPMAMARAFPA